MTKIGAILRFSDYVVTRRLVELSGLGQAWRKVLLSQHVLYVRAYNHVHIFPKNTESLQSWSFSNRNDRKTIVRVLRGDIDFSKNKSTFWIPRFLDLRKLTICGLCCFSNIWKDNSSNIGFSMKNDPWRFNFQLSTTFRRGVKS